MCLNLYKVQESLLKVLSRKRGSLISSSPALLTSVIKFKRKLQCLPRVQSSQMCIKIVAYSFISTCGNYSICHKFRHHSCEAYSSIGTQEITTSVINIGDTNDFEETYQPCLQSGSLALQEISLHEMN